MSGPEVYLLGEAMLEVAPAAEAGLYRLGVAGDSFNTAVALAQSGTACRYLSAVGDDAASDRLLAAMGQWGVDCEKVLRLQGAGPGLYLVDVDDRGERSFSYWRKDSAAARLFNDPEALTALLASIEPGRWLYLTGISLAIAGPAMREQLAEFADRYRAGGGRLVFDCNHRPRLWGDGNEAVACYETWFARSDLLLPGLDDLLEGWGLDEPAAVDWLLSLDCPCVVLKRGASGPRLLSDEEDLEVGSDSVDAPVDTTGAGDAFNGALLSALLRGESAADAARFAHRVALEVVQSPGALLPLERWEQLRQARRNRG